MKRLFFGVATVVCAVVATASVEVAEGIQVSRNAETDLITVTYSLVATEGETEGIVTAKLLDANGQEIKGSLWLATGDIFCRVKTGETLSFAWRGDALAPGVPLASCQVKVSAWGVKTPPDYMVVDLAAKKDVKYYENADQVPGGVKSPTYLMNKILMRKIPAALVVWQGGNANPTAYWGEHAQRPVTLTSDYYMGVFEVTQWQYWTIDRAMPGARPNGFASSGDPDKRLLPVQTVNFNHIRGSGNAIESTSWLGLAREKTGVDFDLPTQAQWEYACRAGTSGATYGPLADIAVYTGATGPSQGGSKLSNDWGLYDTIGNMYEFCLDWLDPEAHTYTAAETNPTGPAAYIDFNARSAELGHKTDRGNAGRMWCGGCFNYGPTYATATMPYGWGKLGISADVQGFRVCCVIK